MKAKFLPGPSAVKLRLTVALVLSIGAAGLSAGAARSTTAVSKPAAADHAGVVEVCRLRNAPADIGANLTDWNRTFLGASRENSRGFLLLEPATGPWPVCLFLAEAVYWRGTTLIAGLREAHPMFQEDRAAGGRATYNLSFAEIDLRYEFVPARDHVDLLGTVANKSDEAGEFGTSSCFALNNHPLFYDCEMLRTYLWTRDRGFVPLRKIPRPGDCVRWIEPSDSSRFGGPRNPGTMAVVSRDGRWVFASARFEDGAPFYLEGNTWLNCLHTEARVTIGAHSSRATHQRLYFLKGDLKTLQARLQQDLSAR